MNAHINSVRDPVSVLSQEGSDGIVASSNLADPLKVNCI